MASLCSCELTHEGSLEHHLCGVSVQERLAIGTVIIHLFTYCIPYFYILINNILC